MKTTKLLLVLVLLSLAVSACGSPSSEASQGSQRWTDLVPPEQSAKWENWDLLKQEVENRSASEDVHIFGYYVLQGDENLVEEPSSPYPNATGIMVQMHPNGGIVGMQFFGQGMITLEDMDALALKAFPQWETNSHSEEKGQLVNLVLLIVDLARERSQ